jgi:hypothetical protein
MGVAVIEWGKLAELLWAAPLAGIVVAVTYSLLILGASRAGEARRAGAMGTAAGYGALALVGAAGFFGTVAFALVIILNK